MRYLKNGAGTVPKWYHAHPYDVCRRTRVSIAIVADMPLIAKGQAHLEFSVHNTEEVPVSRSLIADENKKVASPPIVTTSNVVTPTVEKTNDDFQTMGKKKKKGKSKSTNGGQFAGPSVKQNVRYEPKTTLSAPKKGATNVGNASKSSSMLKTAVNYPTKDNITTSNSYSVLNDEEDEEEHVENVYNESANLFSNTKTDGSSSFTAVAG
ncbi:hypothetical protein Tco_0697282 [Tanacetum coccineum]